MRYARYLDFVDMSVVEDLTTNPPSRALADQLQKADLIVESGAVSEKMADVCANILSVLDQRHLWFLYSP